MLSLEELEPRCCPALTFREDSEYIRRILESLVKKEQTFVPQHVAAPTTSLQPAPPVLIASQPLATLSAPRHRQPKPTSLFDLPVIWDHSIDDGANFNKRFTDGLNMLKNV